MRLTKRQHGRDPALRELERKARSGHAVLDRVAASEVILAAGSVDGGVQVSGRGGVLLAHQDGEVVVGHVHARVALGLQRRAEEDQVLGDGRVQDHHCALFDPKKNGNQNQRFRLRPNHSLASLFFSWPPKKKAWGKIR